MTLKKTKTHRVRGFLKETALCDADCDGHWEAWENEQLVCWKVDALTGAVRNTVKRNYHVDQRAQGSGRKCTSTDGAVETKPCTATTTTTTTTTPAVVDCQGEWGEWSECMINEGRLPAGSVSVVTGTRDGQIANGGAGTARYPNGNGIAGLSHEREYKVTTVAKGAGAKDCPFTNTQPNPKTLNPLSISANPLRDDPKKTQNPPGKGLFEAKRSSARPSTVSAPGTRTGASAPWTSGRAASGAPAQT